MSGRAGLGAVVGAGAGATLAGLLILLPAARDGDYYEITDPLVFLGLPLLVIGAAVGAIAGALIRRSHLDSKRRSGRPRAAVIVGCLMACMIGVWLWLWGNGSVNFPS